MDNYIVINGKKAELTQEQLKALGIEVKKPSPFCRSGHFGEFYLITATGEVVRCIDHDTIGDRKSHKAANYCTDRVLLQQQAYRETLARLLWRFSMEHDGDKINWDEHSESKYYLFFDNENKEWVINYCYSHEGFECVHFYTSEIAKQAIQEIIKPFIKSHPDFII